MRVKQTQFFRKVGVRERGQLTAPRLITIDRLTLPLESIYHFRPNDTSTLGPTPQDPLIESLDGRVFIQHVTELATNDGRPRRTVHQPGMLERDFRKRNRRFRPLRKTDALTISSRNALVVNYGFLSTLYRYTASFKASYYRWSNINNTFWREVKLKHDELRWNQYIDLTLPDVIPTYAQMNRLRSGLSETTLGAFTTPASLDLFDFWTWLGEDRELSGMSVLPDEALGKINFVVRLKGYFFVLNLGVLNEWRKDRDVVNDTGISGTMLQRKFITLLHGLRDLMSGVTSLTETSDEPSAATDGNAGSKTRNDAPPGQKPAKARLPETSEAVEESPLEVDSFLPEMDEPVLPEPTSPEAEPPTFHAPKAKVPGEGRVPQLPSEDQSGGDDVLPEDYDPLAYGVDQRADELHEIGLMSGGAHRRTKDEARRYLSMTDPFGSGRSMTEMLTLNPQDLELPEDPGIPDRDTIPDKSMLHSKLRGMQRKYVRDVMHKDIVRSVMGIQKQGIAVKDYSVETVHDAMNHYQIHTVTLKPVRGRQSTIRFRLPVVDEDGRFISNGVTSKMRLQRSDVPIRKINPSRVALTSYYNKTFVDRSTRKINDFGKWLTRGLVNRGFDEHDDSVTDLHLSNVFDSKLDLPRIYSLLAKRIATFRSGNAHLTLDYHHRLEWASDHGVTNAAELETEGLVFIGVYGTSPLLVDRNNVFYVYEDNVLEVVGPIQDLLGLDMTKAPVEVAEMTVSNKVLPVGFVMAYQMGLSELLKWLGCEASRHPRGQKLELQSDEYKLTFHDEVLVLSKLDQRSTMILAGLNRYQNTLRQFSVWDFDNKDVYFQLLEDTGLGVRYLREIDELFKAWVDPITEQLLEDMGEPVTFDRLLERSVELLQTDFSPAEVDGAYMRYRGYERFAGMVYGELSRAAKIFNGRMGTGDYAVDLNPHAVWQKVVQDPSVAPVEEANPIQDIREQEVMTYRGDGGRSGKSMVERTRIYHDSDVGVVSESTVDSGDVGVVAYLAPDANFTNLRGQTRPYDKERDGAARLLSTSALAAPCVDHDDHY